MATKKTATKPAPKKSASRARTIVAPADSAPAEARAPAQAGGWRDTTAYHEGTKAKDKKPRTWALSLAGGAELVVHALAGTGEDQRFASLARVSFSQAPLGALAPKEAQRRAAELALAHLRPLVEQLEKELGR